MKRRRERTAARLLARARGSGEAGESLVELMVTISIMAVAVITIVSSMAAGILLSSRHQEQSKAGTLLVSAAESIKNQEFDSSCPPASYNPTAGVSVPSGYSVSSSVSYLDSSGATANCTDNPSPALQKVTITVGTPAGYTTHVDVVKRDGT
jgi:hypothetical protein